MKGFYWCPENGAKEMDSRTKALKKLFEVCGLLFQIHQKISHDILG
jgi:hypothetical protein